MRSVLGDREPEVAVRVPLGDMEKRGDVAREGRLWRLAWRG